MISQVHKKLIMLKMYPSLNIITHTHINCKTLVVLIFGVAHYFAIHILLNLEGETNNRTVKEKNLILY